MLYSEAKEIIKILRYAGWYKVKGEPFYKKTWDHNDLRYGQTLYFDELGYNKLKVVETLRYYELKAAKAFSEIG